MPEHRPPAAPALGVGSYVSYRERSRTRYGVITQVEPDGRQWFRGVYAEDIPAGTIVTPVVTRDGRWVLAAGKRPRPFTPPPRWRSGIPCCNRRGQPAVIDPQCDGTEDAETVLRTAPGMGQPVPAVPAANPLASLEDLDRWLAGPAPDPVPRDGLQAAEELLGRLLDIRDHYLCRRCAGAFMPGGHGRVLDDTRTGALHSIRPD